jgi:hypothetical protein
VTVGCCFTPVSGWDGHYGRFDPVAQDTHPFWTRPVNQRRPVVLACPERSRRDASTTASLVVNLSHLLDGITTSGSPYSAVSSRFSRLRTSRPGGDEAVSRTTSAVGLDEITQLGYHRTNITLQLLKNSQPVLYRPAPDLERSVSDERVAPNQCTRMCAVKRQEELTPKGSMGRCQCTGLREKMNLC